MNTIVSVLIGLLIFCVIVTIHEGGHFIAAKLCGIYVSEFAIGMGPVIFKKQGKETLFTLRALPVGGFCSMGEDEEAVDENSFRKKPVWKRMIVIVAGACMNLILGLILSAVFFLVSGKGVTSTIAYFADDAVSPGYGLAIGDEIVKVNGLRVLTANDIIYQFRNDDDGCVDFVIRRNGQLMTVSGVQFNMVNDEESGKQVLNYDFKVYSEKITVKNLLPYSIKTAAYDARIVLMSLMDIIRGKYGVNELSGPVGIVNTITEITKEFGLDWSYIIEIAMLITINVGIFNLLPLPALDGGRFVFLVIELIRRRQFKAETEGLVHFVGLSLFMVLMLIVTFNDIKSIFIK